MKVFNAKELHILKLLKVSTAQIYLALYPCNPVFINNLSMTAISVKKTLFYFVECKIESKNYIQNVLLTFRTAAALSFSLNATTATAGFGQNLAVTYGAKLHL